MGGLCNTVTGFAGLFIVLAFVVALVETGLVLWAKAKALRSAPNPQAQLVDGAEGLAKVLEALAKLLASLKDLPAWVAILLAGLALAWTATSAPGLCTIA
jgi:hypothetical protein